MLKKFFKSATLFLLTTVHKTADIQDLKAEQSQNTVFYTRQEKRKKSPIAAARQGWWKVEKNI